MKNFELEKFKKRIKEDLDDLSFNDVFLVIEDLGQSPLLSIRWIKDGSLVEKPFDNATDAFKIYQMVELTSILDFLGDKTVIYYSNGEVSIKKDENWIEFKIWRFI